MFGNYARLLFGGDDASLAQPLNGSERNRLATLLGTDAVILSHARGRSEHGPQLWALTARSVGIVPLRGSRPATNIPLEQIRRLEAVVGRFGVTLRLQLTGQVYSIFAAPESLAAPFSREAAHLIPGSTPLAMPPVPPGAPMASASAPGAASTPAPAGAELLARLQDATELLRSGHLSQAEFEALKSKLLGG